MNLKFRNVGSAAALATTVTGIPLKALAGLKDGWEAARDTIEFYRLIRPAPNPKSPVVHWIKYLEIRNRKHELHLTSGPPPRSFATVNRKKTGMSTNVEHVQLPVSQGTSSTATGSVAFQNQGPDDVVITLAIRSPLCKARKGGFKDTRYFIEVY